MADIFDTLAKVDAAPPKDIFDYLAEGQKWDDKKQQINAEIAATRERLARPLDTQSGVLREQPTMLEAATQPGGIASAENLGMIVGGTGGALLGAPGGPPGAFLGGILGASGGAALGRGWEMVLEKIYGPYRKPGNQPLKQPDRSTGEVVSEMGEASQRGMVGQAVGSAVGAGIGAVGKKFIAPMASQFTPGAEKAAQTAKDAGITLSPAQVLDSPRLARMEGVANKGIAGVESARAFSRAQAQQSAAAVDDFAESLAPGLGKAAQDVEAFTKAAASGRLEGMKATVDKLVSQVAGGATPSARTAGETVKAAKDRMFDAVKVQGGRLYNAVRDAAGDAAKSIESPHFKSAVDDIAAKEAELTGVQLPSASVARGAASQLNPKSAPAMAVGDTVTAARSAYLDDDLPQQIIDKYGLGQSKTWTLDALREWQSRLGYLSENAATPKARRDFSKMFAGVSQDIQAWGDTLPKDVNGLLRKANDFWRTRVADTYYNRVINGIDKADPDTVANLIFDPKASPDMLARVRRAIGPDAYGKAAGSYLDGLMSRATNLDGSFSPTKVLRTFDQHDPETLKLIFGNKINGQQLVAKMFQRNPTKLIEAVAGKEGDGILNYVVPKGGGVQTLSELRQLLPSKDFDRFSGAFLKNVVDKSYDNTGQFSFQRFLTQVNGPTGYKPSQMRYLLGSQYGSFRELVDLFSRMERSTRLSANPSGTAQGILSSFQTGGAILLGADVLSASMSGQETAARGMSQLGAGLVILSPSLVAKAMYSPGGIRWLTVGMKAPPGSKSAVVAIRELTKSLTANSMGVKPQAMEQASSPPVEDTVTRSNRDKLVELKKEMSSYSSATPSQRRAMDDADRKTVNRAMRQ